MRKLNRLIALAGLALGTQFAAAKPANVLLFLVDDLGWRDVACYGSEVYETPAIDRLAAEGMRFTDAYVAYPRCLPSRFSLYSGKFPQRAKVPPLSDLKTEEFSIAEALKQEGGYATFFAGKWHLSHVPAEQPDGQGFDTNVAGGAAGAPHSYLAPYNKARGAGGGKEKPIEGLDDAPEGEFLTERLTRETDQFIRARAAAKDGKPFFAVLAHYGVHTPFEAPEDDVKHFKGKLAGMSFDGPELIERDGQTKRHQNNATYAAMVATVDRSLASLLRTLDELKLADDTIVIFTSDNGGLSNRGANNKRELATSNLPLRAGKGHLYEGGVRVPFIVRWPGVVKPATTSAAVVALPDIYPTLLAAGGMPLHLEQHVDGVSFLPALRGERHERAPIVWHNTEARPGQTGDRASSAMRDGKWKVLYFYEDQRTELYDLQADIGENHDLAAEMPEKAKELREAMFAHLKKSGAFMPGSDKTEIRKIKKAAKAEAGED